MAVTFPHIRHVLCQSSLPRLKKSSEVRATLWIHQQVEMDDWIQPQKETIRIHPQSPKKKIVALSTHKVEIIALITCRFWAMYASKWHQKCLASSAAVGYWPLPPHHLVAVFVLNCHHVDPPPGFETLHENKGQSHKIKSSKTLETCDFTMVFPCFSQTTGHVKS